ncbi:MAG: hypothetical protein E2O73_07265 [Deltaproteobacteria bacterium]|nr:MAG: hypothetical protein E2O73_07265 [Deltaproteobacteria bacterium]
MVLGGVLQPDAQVDALDPGDHARHHDKSQEARVGGAMLAVLLESRGDAQAAREFELLDPARVPEATHVHALDVRRALGQRVEVVAIPAIAQVFDRADSGASRSH